MIDDAALDRDLAGWLRSASAGQMSAVSIDRAVARARSIEQRGSFHLTLAGPTAWPAQGRFATRPLAQWLSVAMAAAVLVIAGVVVLNSFVPRNGFGPVP